MLGPLLCMSAGALCPPQRGAGSPPQHGVSLSAWGVPCSGGHCVPPQCAALGPLLSAGCPLFAEQCSPPQHGSVPLLSARDTLPLSVGCPQGCHNTLHQTEALGAPGVLLNCSHVPSALVLTVGSVNSG